MQKLQSETSHSHLMGGAGSKQDSRDNDPANMSQQHSVLNAFDFAAIDEMDPALGN
jgi:hypothetical protein